MSFLVREICSAHFNVPQVQLRQLLLGYLFVRELEPRVKHVSTLGVKANSRPFICHIRDIEMMPAETTLVRKVPRGELEVVGPALFGGQDVQVV